MRISEIVGGKKVESRNLPVQLTQAGQEKIDRIGGGGLDLDIMYSLSDNGPSNISELSKNTRHHPKQVERAVQRLQRQGFVRYARTDY